LNFKRFIEDDQIAPGFELNSIQQGFLCSAAEHRMFDDYSVGVNPDVRGYLVIWDIRHDNSSYRTTTVFMTLWVATPTVRHTGEYSIETLMSTNVIFLLQISCETIFACASFDMSRVPEKAMNLRGVLTPISTFVLEASISRPVAGGQVRKEKDN
jgi:hypothetical protein